MRMGTGEDEKVKSGEEMTHLSEPHCLNVGNENNMK